MTDSVAAQDAGTTRATSAGYFDSLFTRSQSGEWTGGDIAYSRALPDGRSFWLFGDAFTDTVYPDRSRPHGRFIHSVIVLIDSNGRFTSRYGGSKQNPEPFFPAVEPDQLWANCAFTSTDHRQLYVMLSRIRVTGEGGLFGFRTAGNAAGIVSLPDLGLQKIAVISNDSTLDWSSATYEEGDYVYIYGAESEPVYPYRKYMHLCRTSRKDPFTIMEYYSDHGWDTAASHSSRLMEGISQQFSFFSYKHKYYLLCQEGKFLGRDIYIWDAAGPAGPFVNKRKIYTAPRAGGKTVCYNATAHLEFSKNDSLLVSYCTNSKDAGDIYKNADCYRPYFVYITGWR